MYSYTRNAAVAVVRLQPAGLAWYDTSNSRMGDGAEHVIFLLTTRFAWSTTQQLNAATSRLFV